MLLQPEANSATPNVSTGKDKVWPHVAEVMEITSLGLMGMP
jgi:hypothetical protein